MCCILVWLTICLIIVLASCTYIGGYYTYLAILYIISAISIIVAIITKKTFVYKIGYYLMYFYTGLDAVYSGFFLGTFWFFTNIYWDYVGYNPYINIYDAKSVDELKKLINSSFKIRLIITSAIFAKVIMLSIFVKYLKGKIKIFEAYKIYAKNKKNRLITDNNTI